MSEERRSERLKLLRRNNSLTQRKAADVLGIPFGTYGGYEHNDERKIPIEVLTRMADLFKTTIEYIEKGEPKHDTDRPPFIIFIDSTTQKEKISFVPHAAQAGYVKNFNETEYLRQLPTYSLPGFTNGTFRMFPVEGDSMLPTFSPGDIVICEWVEHFNSIKDNDCYVIVSIEGICVKRCINAVKKRKAIIIESDNPEYKPDLIPIESVLEIWHCRARITRQ
jgi:transcriptional regulator with XRE-family HTH domain